jgi:carboxylesterase type B
LVLTSSNPSLEINLIYANSSFYHSCRLGALGFLASQELVGAGIRSNNGMRDQRIALTWIREHISGFGGDPDNITVVGVSTVASKSRKNFAKVIASNPLVTLLVSCLLHLESPQPLFKRIFAMGGTPLLLKPTPQVTETAYTAVVTNLGFTAMTPEERIKALEEATAEDLLVATGNLPKLPVVNGELITVPATFSQWSFKEKVLPGAD